MYYYTISIDSAEMEEILRDLDERINAFSKRRKPFSVLVTEEEMGETMGGKMSRFNLVVSPNFEVKSERQALKFCQNLRAATDELQKMNDANYVVVPPAKRGGLMNR